jgi:3-oxoacyl-[acyl-carrier-protein] synthase II
MSNSARRVVITGIGLISPLGNEAGAFWDSLIEGRSGVAPFSFAPPDAMPVSFGAEARNFHESIEGFGTLPKDQAKAIRKGLKVMCRECQMGVAAAQRSIADARLAPGRFDPERVGISFGTDHMVTLPEDFSEGVAKCLDSDRRFESIRWATDGMPKMNPLWLLKYLPNMPASHLAIYNDFRGPNNSLTLREAAANIAIGEAFQIIVRGTADVMVVGATGTRIHPIKAIHARQQEELAECKGDPARASRPFDRHRTGMVLGEGAASIVLEELSHALARGATVYGEVLSGTSSSVADSPGVARRDVAMKNAIQTGLQLAEISPEAVGFVCAHGIGTRSGDIEEAWAINQVFGARQCPIPVVAPKGHFGNLGAGSGMIELIAGLLALRHDRLIPVMNYCTPDPQCHISVVSEDHNLPSGGCFVNLSATPQGQASAAVVARWVG